MKAALLPDRVAVKVDGPDARRFLNGLLTSDIETLTPESDFAAFMNPKVKEELRRLALKKLFGDPHFNVPDPFEPYSRDWTVGEPIPEEMLKTLAQARSVLFTEPEKKEPPVEEPEAKHAGDEKQDEPGRQDT